MLFQRLLLNQLWTLLFSLYPSFTFLNPFPPSLSILQPPLLCSHALPTFLPWVVEKQLQISCPILSSFSTQTLNAPFLAVQMSLQPALKRPATRPTPELMLLDSWACPHSNWPCLQPKCPAKGWMKAEGQKKAEGQMTAKGQMKFKGKMKGKGQMKVEGQRKSKGQIKSSHQKNSRQSLFLELSCTQAHERP